MFKKIMKALFIYAGTSWFIYGVSENLLTIVKSQESQEVELDCELVLIKAFKNFKEAWKLLHKEES